MTGLTNSSFWISIKLTWFSWSMICKMEMAVKFKTSWKTFYHTCNLISLCDFQKTMVFYTLHNFLDVPYRDSFSHIRISPCSDFPLLKKRCPCSFLYMCIQRDKWFVYLNKTKKTNTCRITTNWTKTSFSSLSLFSLS